MARAHVAFAANKPVFLLGLFLLSIAEDIDDEILALMFLFTSFKKVASSKHGRHGRYWTDRHDFSEDLLNRVSDKLFRSFCRCVISSAFELTILTSTRMSREAFWHVHDLIAGDTIFLSRGRRPQRPVSYQLVAYLVKFGGMPGIKAVGTLGLAEGSVSKYASRVTRALRNIRVEHLFWPGKERKTWLKEQMADYGFPGCLGSVNGTLIRLSDKPLRDPFSYYCRKKFYAVSFIFFSFGMIITII